jgi:branched-chain amino acid transport system substrate-binding protein
MVQVNPANTNPALTSPVLRVRQEPATYRHRLAYLTYYWIITTDAMQGPADAAYLKEKLHADTYFVVDDTLTYGAGIAGAAQAYGAKIGLRLVGSAHLDPKSLSSIASSADTVSDLIVAKHPDAVFYGGDGVHLGAPLAQDLRRKGYAGPLVGGDALHSVDFIKLVGNGAANSYASETGFDLATTSKSFRDAYQRRFHTPQQPYDAPAYDAANITLHAIYLAATQGTWRGSLFQMRAAILPYVAHVRWHGATGVTSFDKNGDNRHRVISLYGTRNGQWVFVGVAPPVRGVSPTG